MTCYTQPYVSGGRELSTQALLALRWWRKHGTSRRAPENVLYHLVTNGLIEGTAESWVLTETGREALEALPHNRTDDMV